MVPRPSKHRETASARRKATSTKRETTRFLIAVWLTAAIALVGIGISWQVTRALDGRMVELGVFVAWLMGLLAGARYLDARYE